MNLKSIIEYGHVPILSYIGLGLISGMIAVTKLRKEMFKCHSFEDYVNLAYSLRGMDVSVQPIQVKEEITQLLKLLAKLRPMVVCEIGTADGGTLFLLSRVSHWNATIISIDLPSKPFSRGYP